VLAYTGHYIAYIGHDPQQGLTALERAQILNPNSATVAMLKGWVHIYLDQPEPAIDQLQRVRRISPLHPHMGVATAGLAHAQMIRGDPEAATALYERALTEYPEFATTQLGLMSSYWALGRTADAQRMADWLRAKVPDMTVSSHVHARRHESARLLRHVTEAMAGLGFPD
jgi:tetratricopeptide (TPR) repeat protein